MRKFEDLIAAISAMNPHGQKPESALLFYDVIWAAVCHQTERCARFYQDDGSPEGTLYHVLSQTLSKVQEGNDRD